MKKNSVFRSYLFIWVIMFVLYTAVAVLLPALNTDGTYEYDVAFGVGYLLTAVAFVLHFGTAFFAFSSGSNKKLFYNVPMIRASYIGLVFMMLVSVAATSIPSVPDWTGAVVCFIVVLLTLVAVMKASAAAEIVADVDEKVKGQTSFIKMTTVDAQNMVASAKSDAVKAECQKVFEAIRYSDPMSSKELNLENAQITVKMGEMAAAVGADDADKAAALASELIALVQARNNKCKALK